MQQLKAMFTFKNICSFVQYNHNNLCRSNEPQFSHWAFSLLFRPKELNIWKQEQHIGQYTPSTLSFIYIPSQLTK
jgi:hypothetical protein